MNKLIPILLCGAAATAGAQTLQVSMEEAIAAALDRNFAIRIERLGPEIARESLRGAAGQYDPVLYSSYQYERNELVGFTNDQESAVLEAGVSTTLPWGTEIGASITTYDRTTPRDPLTDEFTETLSTTVTSFTGITVTQPILRGAGLDGAHTAVRIARESTEVAWETFRSQVMDTVEATIGAYQNLYFAQENLRIAERNRDLAVQLLKDNQKRVETGAMAPLDIVQAESEAALREVSVISARALLKQAQNALKSLIWDDPGSVLSLDLQISPPQEPEYIAPDPVRDFQLAMESLPEYLSTESALRIREWELRQTRRNALPRLDLVGSAGRLEFREGFGTGNGDAFDERPTSYSIGAVFSMPFPNRSRSAERIQAHLRRNQAELALQQLEQTIRLELDNASTQLVADWERIRAARTARELSEKSLRAEEKKLQVGTSTTFVVLRLQGDLAVAEIRESNALADYNVSLARYHRTRGRILEVHNISLEGSRP